MTEAPTNAGTRTPRGMRVPCALCGTEVQRSPAVVARNGGIAYCGQACYRLASRGKSRTQRQRSDFGVRRVEYVTRACEQCGKPVERSVNDKRERVFCGVSCAGKAAHERGRSGRPRSRQLGERVVHPEGYVFVHIGRGAPMANSKGMIAEHRLVMAEHIGRPLLANENVHHVNGDKTDNRIENLELWVRSQPHGQRARDLLEWAREIVNRYGDIELML